jgi:hypothetical protein
VKARAVLILLLTSAAIPGLAADEPPVAMVMSLAGGTTPPIATMSEIPAGTPLQLAPGAELSFLHYTRCKLVTVAGGTLTVTRNDYSTDGRIVAEKDGPCPRVHQLSSGSSGTAGGLVMRGVGGAPRWPLDREIVFAGLGTDRLRTAAIYAEDQPDTPIIQLDVSGQQARFPASAAPLAANQRYVLRLTTADRPQPLDIPFIGTAPDGPSLFVVLRGP